jgi:hypothetical protein
VQQLPRGLQPGGVHHRCRGAALQPWDGTQLPTHTTLTTPLDSDCVCLIYKFLCLSGLSDRFTNKLLYNDLKDVLIPFSLS